MTDYVYYNRNPDDLNIEDCVCRAISTAIRLDYDATNNLLKLIADMYNCDKLCVCCYRHLLEDIFECRYYECHDNETVKEVTKSFPDSTLIIRISGHLTMSLRGRVFDTWDCSDKRVDCFWIVV
jgi:hypothetical protein